MEMVIFGLITGFFAILGMVSFIGWIMSSVGGSYDRVTLVFAENGTEDMEAMLRCAYNGMRWDRWISGGELIVVDRGADAHTRTLCEVFARDRADVRLCSCEELAEAMAGKDICKTLIGILY